MVESVESTTSLNLWGLELVQGYDAEHRAFDEARWCNSTGVSAKLCRASPCTYMVLCLSARLTARITAMPGYHGQVLAALPAVAVQILSALRRALIGNTDACGGDVRQLRERGQQFDGGKTVTISHLALLPNSPAVPVVGSRARPITPAVHRIRQRTRRRRISGRNLRKPYQPWSVIRAGIDLREAASAVSYRHHGNAGCRIVCEFFRNPASAAQAPPRSAIRPPNLSSAITGLLALGTPKTIASISRRVRSTGQSALNSASGRCGCGSAGEHLHVQMPAWEGDGFKHGGPAIGTLIFSSSSSSSSRRSRPALTSVMVAPVKRRTQCNEG